MKIKVILLTLIIYSVVFSTAFAVTDSKKETRKNLELQLKIKQQQLKLHKLNKQIHTKDETDTQIKEADKESDSPKATAPLSEAFDPVFAISAQAPVVQTMKSSIGKPKGSPKGLQAQLLFPKIYLAVGYAFYQTKVTNHNLDRLYQLLPSLHIRSGLPVDALKKSIEANETGSVTYQLAQVAFISPIFPKTNFTIGMGIGKFSTKDLDISLPINGKKITIQMADQTAMSFDLGLNYALTHFFGLNVGYSLLYAKSPIVLPHTDVNLEPINEPGTSNVLTVGATLFF